MRTDSRMSMASQKQRLLEVWQLAQAQAPSSSSAAGQSPSAQEFRYKKAGFKDVGEDHPFYRCIVKTASGSICSLCGKWLDIAHMSSAKRLKNYERATLNTRRIIARSLPEAAPHGCWRTCCSHQEEAQKKPLEQPQVPSSTSSDGGGFDETTGYCNSSDDAEELQEWPADG